MTTTKTLYRDASLSIDERVSDLLGRMTIAEKVAQLGSVWSFEIVGIGTLNRERAKALVGNGVGQVTRLAGATNLGACEVAELANEVQRFLIQETRLGIPAIIHEESLHGLVSRDAPSFQQSIGAAASWDTGLVQAMAATLRRRMLATGARQSLAPVLDVTRDPRWGRIEETYGEDPYLAAELGCAYVRGIQGERLSDGVIATGKHMVGHGLAEGGLNQAPAHMGPREMRDEQLFPFEAAVREAMDRLARRSSAPLVRSSLWRSAPVDCPPGSPFFINAVAGLAPLAAETGQAFMVRTLHEAPEQVTILSTGPLSTLAAALDQDRQQTLHVWFQPRHELFERRHNAGQRSHVLFELMVARLARRFHFIDLPASQSRSDKSCVVLDAGKDRPRYSSRSRLYALLHCHLQRKKIVGRN
jgi:hypothetical protein